MAGKALATFFLLVTLLQVRAQFTCYSDETCGVSAGATVVEVSSARECCLQGLPVVRSYVPTDGSTACKKCFVIGFSPNNLTIKEEPEPLQREVHVTLLTSAGGLSESVLNGIVDVTVQLNHATSRAILGSDFKINEGNVSSIVISNLLQEVIDRREGIRVKAINDNDTGEVEHFELEVTSVTLTDEDGANIDVFAGAPLIVNIADDDIILVEFSLNEFRVEEGEGVKTVNFTIKEAIPAATHFIVRAMTYKDYDDEYPALKAKYPDIKPYALQDEYDQAESEDFVSTSIPFTIRRDSLTPDRTVAITIIDDDLLEPEEEGLRLVLEVDESKGTRLSEVKFGTRQIAVLRIENSDVLTFGFKDHIIHVNDTPRTIDLELPIRIISGRTEIPINLTFTTGANLTAELGVDYQDFTSARIDIEPPDKFAGSSNILYITLNGDDIFEPREFLEINMEYDFKLPEPFKPKHTNATSPLNSVVVAPLDGRMMTQYRSTIIVIDEAITELHVNLTVPKVVHEGYSFHPNLSVSHKVNVTFRVVAPALYGTATKNLDYSFQSENVLFGPTSNMNTTNLPVVISKDDLVEPNETFNVTVRFSTSPSDIQDLLIFNNPRQTITIVDQNSARIGYETPYDDVVEEDDGFAYLTVTVMEDQLADNAEVVVRFYTSSGTALSGVDFEAVDKTLMFSGALQEIEVAIPIIDDTEYEKLPETFQVHLQLLSSNVNATVDQAPVTITINDTDPPPAKACVLSSNLVLHTLSNEKEPGQNINISMGCGRKLVTSCDPNVDLEIRADFLKDNFASTYVAILYEDYTVTIDDNLDLHPSASPSDRIQYTVGTMSASVFIADISLLTTRNHTALTISTENNTLQLAGLCGDLSGNLFYPDCTDKVGVGQPFDELIQSYMLKPSDQILPERLECGITANDTVISDPLMTVPIHAPEFGENLNLCYEIHGAADTYFNLVSDECTSVNAHYTMASSDSNLNIIDSMSIVAVDNDGICHNITIDAGSCYPDVHGNDEGSSERRKRNGPNLILDENGVSVVSYASRVRISVPNCEDNALVMWVVCQNQSLYDYTRDTTVGPVEMIKFEITRGLNLHEFSHGLLGQFWNIPIEVVQYTGPTVYSVDSPDKFFTVQVEHPSSASPRQFVGIMYDVTWEWKHKKCIYAGDQQGGPAGEVRNDGSVIQGSYEDYAIDTVFGTKFKFGVFNHMCLQV